MSMLEQDFETVKLWVKENGKKFIATRNRFDLEQDIMKAWSTAEDIKTLTGMYFDAREVMTPDELWNKLDAIQQMHDMHMKQLWDTYLQAFELDGYYDPTKQDTEPVPSNKKPKAKAKPKKAKSNS
jgi:hypothetical protein